MPPDRGRTGRSIRLVAAALLVLFVTDGALGWILGVLAAVLAVPPFAGVCPADLPFGLTTCRT